MESGNTCNYDYCILELQLSYQLLGTSYPVSVNGTGFWGEKINNIMQKSIEQAHEIKEQLELTPLSEWESHMDNLKPAINNMLQMYLPKDTTVQEVEILGTVIFNIITEPKKYLN